MVKKIKTEQQEVNEQPRFYIPIVKLSTATDTIEKLMHRYGFLANSKEEMDYLDYKVREIIRDERSPEEIRRVLRTRRQFVVDRRGKKKSLGVLVYPTGEDSKTSINKGYALATNITNGTNKKAQVHEVEPNTAGLQLALADAEKLKQEIRKKKGEAATLTEEEQSSSSSEEQGQQERAAEQQQTTVQQQESS